MTEDTKSAYPSEPAQPSTPLGEAGSGASTRPYEPCRCGCPDAAHDLPGVGCAFCHPRECQEVER